MLNHLVRRSIRSSTNNPRLLTGRVSFNCDSIFTYVFEPDVFERAWSRAVHTFSLVGADDDIAQSGAGFEEEYCVGVAFVVLVNSTNEEVDDK